MNTKLSADRKGPKADRKGPSTAGFLIIIAASFIAAALLLAVLP